MFGEQKLMRLHGNGLRAQHFPKTVGWASLNCKYSYNLGLCLGPCFGCLNFAMVLIHIPGDGANEVLQALRVDRGFVRQLTEHQEVVQIVDVVGQGLVAIFDQILGLGMAHQL